jgi:hypothetical protein
MRGAARVWIGLVLATVAGGCLLAEAEKVGDSGAGAFGGSSGQAGGGATTTAGSGGQGQVCTGDDGGAVAWVVPLAEAQAPANGNDADQRITQLVRVPEGVLAVGHYSETMRALGVQFPSLDNGGHAFLAWLDPAGAFVTTGVAPKLLVYEGDLDGPPTPRGAAALGDDVSVVGALHGALTAGSTIAAPPGNRDAFWVSHAGETVTPTHFGEVVTGDPVRDHLDDVVLGPAGRVIVSGYTDTGLSLAGVDVDPVGTVGTTFVASLAPSPWAIVFANGYEARDAIHLAATPGGRIFMATSVDQGSHDLLGEDIDVLTLAGILVAELTPEGSVVRAALYEGADPGGDLAIVHDLTVGPNGELAVSGSFFGEIHFDPGSAELLVSAGQGDGFVAVFDPDSLEPTHWRSFGSGANAESTWSASFDPCGDLVVAGSFQQAFTLDRIALDAAGPDSLFVAKLSPQAGAALTPVWATTFGHPAHAGCAGASDPLERNCYRLVAGADGVYFAGAFGGTLDLGEGTPRTAVTGEDAFLLRLEP